MRLMDCKKELDNLMDQEKLAGSTLLIFCNKTDIEGAMTAEEIGEFLEIGTHDKRNVYICSCSGITGEGLLEGMDWIVDDIKSRIFMME